MAQHHLILITLILLKMFLVPIIASQETVQVKENEKDVLLFTKDFNAGCTNFNVTYDLPDGIKLNVTHYEVDSILGTWRINVTLIEPLDAEGPNVFYPVNFLYCCPTNGKVTIASIVVVVDDINDSTPKFLQDKYDVTVPENQPVNTVILYNITATDQDISPNLTYSIQAAGDGTMFTGVTAVREVGEININVYDIELSEALDYESSTSYRFAVIVKDQVNHSSTCEVEIHVQDVQDTPPAFTLPLYSGRVDETAVLGTSVATVSAVDGDGQGIRNDVVYSILEGPTDMFEVVSSTGVIQTKGQLDIDGDDAIGENGLVILTIQANEVNSSGLFQYGNTTARVLVQIQIDDANDNSPKFNSPNYSGSIGAGSRAGDIVTIEDGGFISVTDEDRMPTNNRFSLHVERDGKPWSVFEPSVKSQFVQASVLVTLKEPTFLDGLENTHIRFQLVANDTGNGKTSVVDLLVFVVPQPTPAPTKAPILDIPISESDVVVFVMGFLLVLNIVFSLIICNIVYRRDGGSPFGLFGRNSKYYVSGRKNAKESEIELITDQKDKSTKVDNEQDKITSSSSTTQRDNYDLALIEPVIIGTVNTEGRGSVSHAANRNRCDVTLLEELGTVDGEMASNSGEDQNKESGSDQGSQSNRCDLAPLKTGAVQNKMNGFSSSLEYVNQGKVKKFNDQSKDTNKCDVIPLETVLSNKNNALTNLLDKVQQKLSSSGNKGHSQACDLRPLYDDNSISKASLTEVTNSTNSSFSEKTKSDAAPLIDTPPKSKPTGQTKPPPLSSISQVNHGFTSDPSDTRSDTDTLKLANRRNDAPKNTEEKNLKTHAAPIPNKTALTSSSDCKNNRRQFIPTLAPNQTQLTQTGVPSVALALPFGASAKPHIDIPAYGNISVTNPMFKEEENKPNDLNKKIIPQSSHNDQKVSDSKTPKPKISKSISFGKNPQEAASQIGTESDKLTTPSRSSSNVKDYVEAAKTLLKSTSGNNLHETKKEDGITRV